MKERARKKLDKAIDKARVKANKPGRNISSTMNDLARLLGQCGSAPYEGCEEIAAQTLTLMSLAYLRIAEEHLIVNVVRKSAGMRSPEPELGGESWPGLADRAMGYAQRAVDCHAVGASSSALARLLEGVLWRAQEVKQEGAGSGTREVEHVAYSSVVYVPEGMDGPSYWATALSGLKSHALWEYTRTFPNGDWLLSTSGFGG